MPKTTLTHVILRRFRSIALAGTTALLFLFLFALLLSPGIQAGANTPDELVEVLSYEETGCYVITDTPDPEYPNQFTTLKLYITIPYTGAISEATLLLGSNNVRDKTHHPVRVNGEFVATLPVDYRQGCNPVVINEYPLTPTLLHPGTNEVVVTQEGSSDTWHTTYVALRVRGEDLQASDFVPIEFPGGDGVLVDGLVLAPREQSTPRPLLLLFHGWKGTPYEPYLTDYTTAAVSRDWFVASPRQRGHNVLGPGGEPLASLLSQHDAIKLIEYMQSHYDIDPDRIYVGGFSMGGMMAGVMAEKYPDIFAAAVTHEAIGSLKDWYYESDEYRQSQIITETGGTPTQVPFEYKRRSPVEMASNVKNLPIAIVHGISDTVVPPHHAIDFYSAVLASDPIRTELEWYEGDHGDDPAPYGGEWAARFMEPFTRLDNPASLRIRTDESKPYYWLDIDKQSTNNFTEVTVDVVDAEETIYTVVTDTRPVDLSFDLARMGLDARASYVVSQTHPSQGTTIEAVTPINGYLNRTVPAGVTQLQMYPNRGQMPVQLTLQNGRQGYNGTTDTWLNDWARDDVNGDKTFLSLRPAGVHKGLIRFDLQDILPDDVEITAANLKLYDNDDGPSMTVNLYRMLRSWDETTATFNQADSGQSWSIPGGAAGQDWESTPIATLNLDAPGGYATANLITAVRDWVADPASNYGVVLLVESSSFNSDRSLQSSDHWDINVRPKLELIYEPLPASPTPTPTGTPTPTSTPTPTATPTTTPAVGTLSGFVYEDLNGDLIYQPETEPTLAGALVQLWRNGSMIDELTTETDGVYGFVNLSTGTYTVQETAPPGYDPAKPTDNALLNVIAGQSNGIDFGHRQLPTATPPPDSERQYLPLIRR